MSHENDEVTQSTEQLAIEQLPHQPGLGVLGKAALATGVAILSAAYPPATIPLAGAGAGLQAIGERLNTLQRLRTFEFLGAAATESSLTPEDVVRMLLDRDDLVLLAVEAIDAARRSRQPGKAAMLGRSLGAILADDALIDLESIWIRIISAVEPHHIRILGLLLNHTGTMGTGSKLFGPEKILKVSEIGEAVGLQEAVLPLIEDLTRNGLVMHPGAEAMFDEDGIHRPPDAFGQPVKATTLGAQLFARLSVASIEDGLN